MITQILRILKESIRAVPAMKYALAVAGIISIVAMVGALKLSPQAAVFGAIITLVLMVAMVIFAKLTAVAPRHFFLPMQVMMWSFLLVTVATAFLLFTCAFFQWPKGLRELIGPAPSPREERTKDMGKAKQAQRLIAGAGLQLKGRDYTGAWKAVEQALQIEPNSEEARDEQILIAMTWLRNMDKTPTETISEVARTVLPCLYEAVAQAKAVQAADVHAHIGWANFLKQLKGGDRSQVAPEYQQAVAIDPTNVFAHAMWGHWQLYTHQPPETAKAHFRIALKAGREREFVRRTQMSALTLSKNLEGASERLRVADEMRRNQEPFDTDMRSGVFRAVYDAYGLENEQELLALLPARDHLETFRFLTEGSDTTSAAHGYFLARLTEATGDFSKAMSLYRELLARRSSYEQRIKAGLARCKSHTAGEISEGNALVKEARDRDPVTRVKIIRSMARADVKADEVLPALISWVQDEDREVRRAARATLIEFGAGAVSNVVVLLSSRERRDVINAADILGEIGQEETVVVPALVQALRRADPEVSGQIADSLANFGPKAAPASAILIELLTQTVELGLQKQIAYALGTMGPAASEAVPQLTTLLEFSKDPEGFVKVVAAEALGKMGAAAAPAVPALITALMTDDVRLPARAAAALGSIGAEAKAAIPALIEAMLARVKDEMTPYAESLGEIAESLASKGDSPSLPALKKALQAMELANLEPNILSPVRDAVNSLNAKADRP